MTWRCVRAAAWMAHGILVLGLLSGCNSPTLPTPPPVEPYTLDIPEAELLPGGDRVSLSGFALPGATVIFLNRSLLATDIDRAVGVAVAAFDTGEYQGLLRVDLACSATNVIDISQRDTYGRDSEVRRFAAPNTFGDASPPDAGGTRCADGGSLDSGGDGGTEGGPDIDGSAD